PYGRGLAAGTLAILAALIATGLLKPLIDQLIWLGRNYPATNWMPYGSVLGGYGYALKGPSGVEFAATVFILFFVALAPMLPVVAIAAWTWTIFYKGWREVHQTAIPYLLGCMAALIASTLPRSDMMHLAYVAALPYV